MLTKARIAGHPIHPMLVAFPIALYVATVACLIAYGGTADPFWYHTAFVASVAAVVMAAAAAIPGLIDLISLPSNTRAKSTGLQHAALNVFTLVLFVIAAIVLGHDWYNPGALRFGWPLVLGLVGLASLCVAGTLGWKLVQTHHVGIQPTEHPLTTQPIDEIDDLDQLPVTAYPTDGSRQIPLH